jgi:hypothetical protein
MSCKRRWVLCAVLTGLLLAAGLGGWALACRPPRKKPTPFLNTWGASSNVIMTQGLEGVGFNDDKALRSRVAELLEEKALGFWLTSCRKKKAQLPFLITHRWRFRTRYKNITISSTIQVHIPPETCKQLLGLSEKQRLAIIRKPGAISVTRLPGRF